MDRQARTGDTVLVLVAGISYTVQSICTLKITTEEKPIKTKMDFLFFLKYLKFVPQSIPNLRH
jgi:hypothetical protein